MAPAIPFAWFEKIGFLLLAAHLEDQGWSRVLLSVPPGDLSKSGVVRGTDWARAVQAVRERGRAFGQGEGHLRREAYAATQVDEAERPGLRAVLPAFLEASVSRDQQYRYDGIWHDDGGNVDLVAWGAAGALVVEAKGITQQGEAISWRAAAKSTIEVIRRTVGDAELPDARRGLLLPDDRTIATAGAGFIGTLLLAWPPQRSEDERWPIFLVGADGRITEWTIGALRAVTPGPRSWATASGGRRGAGDPG